MPFQKNNKAAQKYTDEQIEAALRETGGLIKPAALLLEMSRWELHQRVRKSPALQLVAKEEREQLYDGAFDTLKHLCEEKKNILAAKYILSVIAGYGSETQINVNQNMNIDPKRLESLTDEEREVLDGILSKIVPGENTESSDNS